MGSVADSVVANLTNKKSIPKKFAKFIPITISASHSSFQYWISLPDDNFSAEKHIFTETNKELL